MQRSEVVLPAGPWLIGVDEAGRGPLAGPVTAAAVLLDPSQPIVGLADSKQLSEAQRESLAPVIRARAMAWAVAHVDAPQIDQLNILQATLLAMRRAVHELVLPAVAAQQSLLIAVDGNRLPDLAPLPFAYAAQAIVRGDRLVPAISAASILAKCARDALMRDYDQRYPPYGFAVHKGYGTAKHLQALAEHGPCPIHRHSFAPVRAAAAV